MWICPACQHPLSKSHQQWQCENRHHYDIGKEGHVNLLLANQKNSRDPGDNKEMINARREFLQQGFYLPLANQLASYIEQFSETTSIRLYDAGCGEGYYQGMVTQQLLDAGSVVTTQGSDISKIAVQKAAKKYPQAQFSVASSFNLPVAEASQNVLLQIFAPADETEIYRVLEPLGMWLQVTPAAGHLWQLKQALYDSPQPFTQNDIAPTGFSLLHQQSLQFEISIEEPVQRENLLKMTPYYWSTPMGKKADVLNAMAQLDIAFDIRVMQKTSPLSE